MPAIADEMYDETKHEGQSFSRLEGLINTSNTHNTRKARVVKNLLVRRRLLARPDARLADPAVDNLLPAKRH